MRPAECRTSGPYLRKPRAICLYLSRRHDHAVQMDTRESAVEIVAHAVRLLQAATAIGAEILVLRYQLRSRAICKRGTAAMCISLCFHSRRWGIDIGVFSRTSSANATILPDDATPKPDGIFGKDTKGIIPFRRLRWCSTCVIVGSTPAVDV